MIKKKRELKVLIMNGRPNKYPYTKNQWEEETTLIYCGDDTSLKTVVESNRITGVINVSLQEE